jgi:hypothetical protein
MGPTDVLLHHQVGEPLRVHPAGSDFGANSERRRPAGIETTFLNEVPRALRRANSLLVPVSISQRRAAVFFFFAAVLRFGAVLLLGATLLFGAVLLLDAALLFGATLRLGPVLAFGAVLRFAAVFFFAAMKPPLSVCNNDISGGRLPSGNKVIFPGEGASHDPRPVTDSFQGRYRRRGSCIADIAAATFATVPRRSAL